MRRHFDGDDKHVLLHGFAVLVALHWLIAGAAAMNTVQEKQRGHRIALSDFAEKLPETLGGLADEPREPWENIDDNDGGTLWGLEDLQYPPPPPPSPAPSPAKVPYRATRDDPHVKFPDASGFEPLGGDPHVSHPMTEPELKSVIDFLQSYGAKVKAMPVPELDAASTRVDLCASWAYFNECENSHVVKLCSRECRRVMRKAEPRSGHNLFQVTMINLGNHRTMDLLPDFLYHLNQLLDRELTTEKIWVLRRARTPSGELEPIMSLRNSGMLFDQIMEMLYEGEPRGAGPFGILVTRNEPPEWYIAKARPGQVPWPGAPAPEQAFPRQGWPEWIALLTGSILCALMGAAQGAAFGASYYDGGYLFWLVGGVAGVLIGGLIDKFYHEVRSYVLFVGVLTVGYEYTFHTPQLLGPARNRRRERRQRSSTRR